jgi:hypothetical protein
VANDEEPREPEEESGGPEEEALSQDPFVEKVRPDPSEPPTPVRVLQGLLGNSDREGYRRLYFTRELDSYAEFRRDDVLYSEPIPSEQPPFVGLDATRVGIRRDAAIEYTRVRAARPVDEFDLDVRLGGAPGREGSLPLGTELDGCGAFHTEVTCRTQCGATCVTCLPTCATCAPTCARTCAPTCAPTCFPTCARTCGQTCAPTCATCARTCAPTCGQTCGTCAPTCGQTCGPTCDQVTCGQVTCFGDTCATCGQFTCGQFTCVRGQCQ